MLKRRAVNPSKKPLVMWSGGLDSTWTLERFAVPVDVLSINLLEGGARTKRAEKERGAREALKPHMLPHRYREATLETDCGLTVGDIVQTAWLAAQYALTLGLLQGNPIYFGGNSDDDAGNESSRVIKARHVLDLFRVVYGDSPTPRYAWFQPEPSRLEQLNDLADIAPLTWSCRDPQPNECGQCKPCTFINAAKSKGAF